MNTGTITMEFHATKNHAEFTWFARAKRPEARTARQTRSAIKINSSLSQSRTLVVVCSKRAALDNSKSKTHTRKRRVRHPMSIGRVEPANYIIARHEPQSRSHSFSCFSGSRGNHVGMFRRRQTGSIGYGPKRPREGK